MTQKESIPELRIQITKLDFNKYEDFLCAKDISLLLFAKLQKLRKKLMRKSQKKEDLDVRFFARLEAEEQIITGLLNLLHQMVIDSLIHNTGK